MESILAGMESAWLAETLRVSRWGYAAVNALHILGIALLVGSVVPLNLRLLGLWRSVPAEAIVRVLVPVAASGLALAIASGALLFMVRAREYAENEAFLLKLAAVGLAVASALLLHRRYGLFLQQAEASGSHRAAAHAAFSILAWIFALACGRLIAFVGN